MTQKELVDKLATLSVSQIEQVCEMVKGFLRLNEDMKDTTPKVCPRCQSETARFIKKGFSGRKQTYQCKECEKKFSYDAGQITFYSHQTAEEWAMYIEDMLTLKSIDECAKRISVCHGTSLHMRHKLLAFFEEAISDVALDGLIEADETYVQESQKGTRVTDREPRKHAEPATKRGISDEKACACFAVDRDSHFTAKCVNMGKPSAEDIMAAIGDKIGDGGVLQCDGAAVYHKLVNEKKCSQVVLKSHSDYGKVYHLNTVNGLHSRFKAMLRHYRGVATKYLNRYLALFVVMERLSHTTRQHKLDTVRTMLRDVRKVCTVRSLKTEGILAF